LLGNGSGLKGGSLHRLDEKVAVEVGKHGAVERRATPRGIDLGLFGSSQHNAAVLARQPVDDARCLVWRHPGQSNKRRRNAVDELTPAMVTLPWPSGSSVRYLLRDRT